jgi:methylmalonyl-CoA mutase C-terminal domain/subunit
MLSGAHMTLAPLVVEEVRKRGSEIPVILGGIVPDHDLDALRAAGITTVLTPGATADEIADQVGAAVRGSGLGA